MARPHTLTGMALLLATCGTPEERLAERALREGAAHYADSAFAAADSAFAMAPDNARAVYDRGLSALADARPTEAAQHFAAAAGLDTLALRPWAWYNRGNALLREALGGAVTSAVLQREAAQARPASDDIADRLRHAVRTDSLLRASRELEARIDSALPGAVAAYKKALRLAPDDDDARHNLLVAQAAWAKRQRERGGDGKSNEQEKALTERAKLLLQQADELVEQYKFKDALKLLQNGLRQEPSLSGKKEYMDKLDLVTKAAENA